MNIQTRGQNVPERVVSEDTTLGRGRGRFKGTISVSSLIVVAGLAAFGVAAAVGHFLVEPYNPGFAGYPHVTWTHVVLGAVYLTFAPVQLIGRIRARAIGYHRWAGRLLVPIGVLVGLSALFLGLVVPFSGHPERIVIGIFGGFFLISLMLGYVRVTQGRIGEHREWMLRALAIGLSVATMRALFIPALMIAGNPSSDQIAMLSVGSFTVAFLLHAAAAEWWIRWTRTPTRGHADDRSPLTVSAEPNPVPTSQGANTAARSGQQGWASIGETND
jgi:hypothetical protein